MFLMSESEPFLLPPSLNRRASSEPAHAHIIRLMVSEAKSSIKHPPVNQSSVCQKRAPSFAQTRIPLVSDDVRIRLEVTHRKGSDFQRSTN